MNSGKRLLLMGKVIVLDKGVQYRAKLGQIGVGVFSCRLSCYVFTALYPDNMLCMVP